MRALRLAFQNIYKEHSRDWAEILLDRWYSCARRCRLEPMEEVALTIERHRHGILRWFNSKIANGFIEGINSLVQAAKAKARGYRSTRTIKAITYLIAGKLDLRLPTRNSGEPIQIPEDPLSLFFFFSCMGGSSTERSNNPITLSRTQAPGFVNHNSRAIATSPTRCAPTSQSSKLEGTPTCANEMGMTKNARKSISASYASNPARRS